MALTANFNYPTFPHTVNWGIPMSLSQQCCNSHSGRPPAGLVPARRPVPLVVTAHRGQNQGPQSPPLRFLSNRSSGGESSPGPAPGRRLLGTARPSSPPSSRAQAQPEQPTLPNSAPQLRADPGWGLRHPATLPQVHRKWGPWPKKG